VVSGEEGRGDDRWINSSRDEWMDENENSRAEMDILVIQISVSEVVSGYIFCT